MTEQTHWPNRRPDWCPHPDCIFLRVAGQHGTCAGRLPRSEPHGAGRNTHRWCVDTRETGHGIFDLQVNTGDLYWFGKVFDAIREDAKTQVGLT